MFYLKLAKSMSITSSSAIVGLFAKSISLQPLSLILQCGQAIENKALFGKFYRTCHQLLQNNGSDLLFYTIAWTVLEYTSKSLSNPSEISKLGLG